MDTALGKVLTYHEKLPPLTNVKLNNSLKNLYLYFHKTYVQYTW